MAFSPNKVQQAVYDRIDAADREERPFFCIGLKSRQHGFSTGIQVEMNRRASMFQRYHTLTMAHKVDAASYIFGMTETMRAHMHPDFRVPKKRGQIGRHLELASPIDSRLDVETAGDREAGRSTGRRAVHASEAAFWPDLAQTLRSLRQIVQPAPGAMFVIESTANGIGNAFHDEWVSAQNNPDSDYEPLFFPWFWDDALRRSVPVGGLGELDAEEQKLEQMGVEPDQLVWRRWAIVNLCGGSLDTFHQEYPATWMEAFLASGRLAFAGLERIIVQDPIRRGSIVGEPFRGGGTLRFVNDPKGPLRVFEPRRAGHDYIVFVDPMGEPRDDMYEARPERNKQDYACIQVIDQESAAQVAVWHGRLGEAELAKEAARIGYVYGTALIAPETVGGYGTTTVHVLNREIAYPNLYRREVYGKTHQKAKQEYGWLTSEQTRPLMVEAVRGVVQEHPWLICDEGTLGEMHTFVVLNGKPQAALGYHDDRVMALGGALAVRMRADRVVRLGPVKRARRVPSLESRAARPEVYA